MSKEVPDVSQSVKDLVEQLKIGKYKYELETAMMMNKEYWFILNWTPQRVVKISDMISIFY
jgi:hypothetical protein